jgi:sterol desaturase/sphingolipid hydroxylase (fatty acid hydroxylase superfamily)
MGPGLLGLLRLPAALHAVLALLALDAVSYTTHRLSHAIPPLWRLHAVHHSDAEVDATTTLRHHPLEALTGAVLSSGAVLILGISPAEVAAYVAAEWAVQSLAHANVALPPRWERVLRRIVVTPGFHKLHHSRERAETDSNYGQVLTIWDDLLRTASSRPVGAPRIEFGLDAFRDPKFQNPHWLLAQPALRQNAVPPGQPEVRLAP